MKHGYKLMVYLDKYQYVSDKNDPASFKPKNKYKFGSILGLLVIYPLAVFTNIFWSFCHWLDNTLSISENQRSVVDGESK